MSQAKVDRYKEEKKNRKQIMAREKRQRTLGTIAGSLVAIALVGWIGVSSYNLYESKKPKETIYTDLSAISEYMQTLNEDAE